MKQVEFTRDMRPHVAGETRVVPDEVAARLVAEGVVKDPPAEFPAKPAAQDEAKPARSPLALPHRRRRDQAYETK